MIKYGEKKGRRRSVGERDGAGGRTDRTDRTDTNTGARTDSYRADRVQIQER